MALFGNPSFWGVMGRPCIPLALFIISLLSAGCFDDVAHDNPFDPLSEGFAPSAEVTGLITDRREQPLSEVMLRLEAIPGGATISTQSDQAGKYTFKATTPGTYHLLIEKDGYAGTRDSVVVTNFETVVRNHRLNGAPVFDEVLIRSSHINRVWPPPTDFTLLEVFARIDDADGVIDLETAWMEVPALNVVDTLQFTEMPGVFLAELSPEDLGLNSMQDLLGEQIYLYTKDRLGFVSSADTQQLVRIIDETPRVVAPQAGTVLNMPQPQLQWVCDTIPFNYTYRIEVVRVDDVVQNVVTTIPNLDPDTVCNDQEGSNQQEGSIQVDVALAIGSYFWTVSIVDDFGNWSRSKEAGFVVI